MNELHDTEPLLDTRRHARLIALECAARKRAREDYNSDNMFAVAARRRDDLANVQRIVSCAQRRVKLELVPHA